MAEKRTRLSDMTKAGRKAEKPTVIGAIRDPQFVRDVLQGLGETATRGITGVLGAPVDITTMAMRPFGYSVPAEQVVGGSEYLGKQLERAGMLSGNRNQLSELLAGLVTPDPLDVAKLGAMAVPVVGRVMREAPRDEAMRIAQANAAKPISEGGLGLPPDNTAMDRAIAMDFDWNATMYHGGSPDITEFDPLKLGSTTRAESAEQGFFTTSEPNQANYYAIASAQRPKFEQWLENAASDKEWHKLADDLELDKNASYDERIEMLREMADETGTNPLNEANSIYQSLKRGALVRPEGGETVYPLVTRYTNPMNEDFYAAKQKYHDLPSIVRAGKSQGKEHVILRNVPEGGHDATWDIHFNPSNIRSRFAAFDPARRYESDLLGAADPRLLGVIGLGTAGALYKTNREKEKDRKREK